MKFVFQGLDPWPYDQNGFSDILLLLISWSGAWPLKSLQNKKNLTNDQSCLNKTASLEDISYALTHSLTDRGNDHCQSVGEL